MGILLEQQRWDKHLETRNNEMVRGVCSERAFKAKHGIRIV